MSVVTPSSFVSLPRPFIVGVVREPDPLNAIATIMNSERDGAQAFTFHLSKLGSQYYNLDDLRTVMSTTSRPIMALNYRSNGNISDADRVQLQLLAVQAGARAVDLPADVLDPQHADWNGNTPGFLESGPPQELSTDSGVVAAQRELINEFHGRGAEVMLSSHTRTVMTAQEVLAHARAMTTRGADAVKIVSACLNEEQMIEALRAVVLLRRELDVPFQYQCHGQHGKLTRIIGPMIGSMLVFCNQRFTATTFPEQPLIAAMRRVFQDVDYIVPESSVDTFDRA